VYEKESRKNIKT